MSKKKQYVSKLVKAVNKRKNDLTDDILQSVKNKDVFNIYRDVNVCVDISRDEDKPTWMNVSWKAHCFISPFLRISHNDSFRFDIYEECRIMKPKDYFSLEYHTSLVIKHIVEVISHRISIFLSQSENKTPELYIPEEVLEKEVMAFAEGPKAAELEKKLKKVASSVSSEFCGVNITEHSLRRIDKGLKLTAGVMFSQKDDRREQVSVDAIIGQTFPMVENERMPTRLRKGSRGALVSLLVDKLKANIIQALSQRTISVSGPYSKSDKAISSLLTAAKQYTGNIQCDTNYGLGVSKNLYIYQMGDDEQYIVAKRGDDLIKAIQVSRVSRKATDAALKQVGAAAEEYLKVLKRSPDSITIHYIIEAPRPKKVSSTIPELANETLQFRICVLEQDGSGYKTGVFLNSSNSNIVFATQHAIFKTLENKIWNIRTRYANRWAKLDFLKIPFYDRCVLYALWNPDDRHHEAQTLAAVKKTMGRCFPYIDSSNAQDVLERYEKKCFSRWFDDVVVVEESQRGRYGKYILYRINSICVYPQFRKPEITSVGDLLFFKDTPQYGKAVCKISESAHTSEEAGTILLTLVKNRKAAMLKEFAETEHFKRLLGMLTESDMSLLQLLMESTDGLKIMGKSLISQMATLSSGSEVERK